MNFQTILLPKVILAKLLSQKIYSLLLKFANKCKKKARYLYYSICSNSTYLSICNICFLYFTDAIFLFLNIGPIRAAHTCLEIVLIFFTPHLSFEKLQKHSFCLFSSKFFCNVGLKSGLEFRLFFKVYCDNMTY